MILGQNWSCSSGVIATRSIQAILLFLASICQLSIPHSNNELLIRLTSRGAMLAGSPNRAPLIARRGVINFAHMEASYSSNAQSTQWLLTNCFWHPGQSICPSHKDGRHHNLSCLFDKANYLQHRAIPDWPRYTYSNFFSLVFFFFFYPSSTRSARTGRIVHNQPTATQCRIK